MHPQTSPDCAYCIPFQVLMLTFMRERPRLAEFDEIAACLPPVAAASRRSTHSLKDLAHRMKLEPMVV